MSGSGHGPGPETLLLRRAQVLERHRASKRWVPLRVDGIGGISERRFPGLGAAANLDRSSLPNLMLVEASADCKWNHVSRFLTRTRMERRKDMEHFYNWLGFQVQLAVYIHRSKILSPN